MLENTFQWKAPEFKWQETPGRNTLIISAIIALLAIVAVLFKNYLLALLLLIMLVVFFITKRQKPQDLTVEIDENGISYGKKFFSWSELTGWWIVYNPPEVKTLHLKPKTSLSPEIVIQLENQNPNDLRNFILNYLPETKGDFEEDLGDKIIRILKI